MGCVPLLPLQKRRVLSPVPATLHRRKRCGREVGFRTLMTDPQPQMRSGMGVPRRAAVMPAHVLPSFAPTFLITHTHTDASRLHPHPSPNKMPGTPPPPKPTTHQTQNQNTAARWLHRETPLTSQAAPVLQLLQRSLQRLPRLSARPVTVRQAGLQLVNVLAKPLRQLCVFSQLAQQLATQQARFQAVQQAAQQPVAAGVGGGGRPRQVRQERHAEDCVARIPQQRLHANRGDRRAWLRGGTARRALRTDMHTNKDSPTHKLRHQLAPHARWYTTDQQGRCQQQQRQRRHQQTLR
jgi:hypothetical protein